MCLAAWLLTDMNFKYFEMIIIQHSIFQQSLIYVNFHNNIFIDWANLLGHLWPSTW